MTFYRLILETTDGPVIVAQTNNPIICALWSQWLQAENVAGECIRMFFV